MLATIILDRFRQDEINDVARAMDKFCQPGDTHLFASSLVYCFSDPVTHEILYIGLTTNIGLRFRQHTGIIECDPECCKLDVPTRRANGVILILPGELGDLGRKLGSDHRIFRNALGTWRTQVGSTCEGLGGIGRLPVHVLRPAQARSSPWVWGKAPRTDPVIPTVGRRGW
ncbi:hypothetical protein OJF2_35480 [Aquisphaera giovannonii]|uniref:GIY-YIG domain-containing protein n=1 Tax=Aquisphaera giovannonii TaxID=406548 RepID=A0A5B9W2Z8_9BACT|nr:GIY-YIG nuclease family protein [Aquisphaera giovannonii]QEH35003.1 hypothetical protein OJF2_35480 [Aquisphaera giovannonii]